MAPLVMGVMVTLYAAPLPLSAEAVALVRVKSPVLRPVTFSENWMETLNAAMTLVAGVASTTEGGVVSAMV